MKAILEFDLPEESSDHRAAIDGQKWMCVAWDTDQYLRGQLKHGDYSEAEMKTLELVREVFRETVAAYGLNFEDYD